MTRFNSNERRGVYLRVDFRYCENTKTTRTRRVEREGIFVKEYNM